MICGLAERLGRVKGMTFFVFPVTGALKSGGHARSFSRSSRSQVSNCLNQGEEHE